MHTWQLQEAKSRFSELVDCTLAEGPQLVTRRGIDTVVVMAVQEFRRMQVRVSLLDTLKNAPRGEALEIERTPEPVRSLEL